MITDTQWDAFLAIDTVAKIDISKRKFNYKKHIKNAYKLVAILLSTTFLMFLILYKHYELNIILTLIYLSVDIINILLEPIYTLKTCYLQLSDKYEMVTSNKVVESGIRVITSLLKTPFCTTIGQYLSMFEELIVVNILFNKGFKINSNGEVIKKEKYDNN